MLHQGKKWKDLCQFFLPCLENLESERSGVFRLEFILHYDR